jgi:hypothetical protein
MHSSPVPGSGTVLPTSASSGVSNTGGGVEGFIQLQVVVLLPLVTPISFQPVQSLVIVTVGTQNAGIQTVTHEVPVESAIA